MISTWYVALFHAVLSKVGMVTIEGCHIVQVAAVFSMALAALVQAEPTIIVTDQVVVFAKVRPAALTPSGDVRLQIGIFKLPFKASSL